MKSSKHKRRIKFQSLHWLDRIDPLEILQEVSILVWERSLPRQHCLASAILYLKDKYQQDSRIEEVDLENLESKPEQLRLDNLSDFLSDNIDIPFKYRYLYYMFSVYDSKQLSILIDTDLSDISRKKQELFHFLRKRWKYGT